MAKTELKKISRTQDEQKKTYVRNLERVCVLDGKSFNSVDDFCNLHMVGERYVCSWSIYNNHAFQDFAVSDEIAPNSYFSDDTDLDLNSKNWEVFAFRINWSKAHKSGKSKQFLCYQDCKWHICMGKITKKRGGQVKIIKKKKDKAKAFKSRRLKFIINHRLSWRYGWWNRQRSIKALIFLINFGLINDQHWLKI